MRSRLLRLLVWLTLIEMVAFVVGQILARRMTQGDERSNVFQLASFFGGKKFESHADDLKSGVVITSMGGIDLDLRDAHLDEDGAELDLKATMGGIRVIVPAEWRVDIDGESMAGGFDARVTPPEDLPVGSPRLHIHAVSRLGGVMITTEDD